MKTIRMGVVGLGGFAEAVCNALLQLAARDDAAPRLVAACDPDLQRNADRATKLKSAGVQVVDDLDQLLALPIDAVWLPVPIALHRPFTERAVAAGKAVLVEKPAAGSLEDVDAMIAARDRSKCAVAVGFQHLYDDATWAMKRRLLAGAIGTPRQASVFAAWPRSDSYFGRNQWAGKVRVGQTIVLDSPANNAMAHFINLALFLLGPTERESARAATVEAELYRVNPIENFDTCTLRITLAGGAALTIAMTHACSQQTPAIIEIKGDHGSLHYDNSLQYALRSGGSVEGGGVEGGVEQIAVPDELLPAEIQNFAAYANGDATAQYASLENARAHTQAVTAASQAAAVTTVDASAIRTATDATGNTLRFIPGVEDALRSCADRGILLHEADGVPWARPGGSIRIDR